MNQERNETFSVIDGNQRLSSLKRFLEDAFPLSGLTSYPELSGLRYSELDQRFQRHISNRVLRCTVILKETHPQVKFDVFERLNSGAVALTRQELRHGLYYGSLLKTASAIAKKLKLDSQFSGRKDKRMKAEELVVRYWALHDNLEAYEKPLATFISSFAESNRNPTDSDLVELENSIKTAHGRVIELFGDHAFTFAKNGHARFNAAVFDAQMLACSKLSAGRFNKLLTNAAKIRKDYTRLQKEPEFSKSVTLATSDKAALQGRVRKISNLLKSI